MKHFNNNPPIPSRPPFFNVIPTDSTTDRGELYASCYQKPKSTEVGLELTPLDTSTNLAKISALTNSTKREYAFNVPIRVTEIQGFRLGTIDT